MKKFKTYVLLFLLSTLCFVACSTEEVEQNTTETKQTTMPKTEEVEIEETKEPEIKANLTKIRAYYEGSTKAGTILNDENEGISVIATYDDGTTKNIYAYKIKKAKKLNAGKTSTILISFAGKNCKLSVKCTTLTPKQYKQKCKTIPYKKLARNPDKYEDKKIKFTGEIIQVVEGDWSTYYRINVTRDKYGFWDDTVYVEFEPKSNKRFLEDDIVTFYGTYDGLYTYESILGASVTIPSVTAKYMILH